MSIQEQAVQKATALLNAVGAKYKIVLENGAEIGELEVEVKKPRTRSPSKYPHGTLSAYYSPFVDGLKVGEQTKIPFSTFEAEELRGPLTAKLSKIWGPDSYITAVNRQESVIEVVRYC